MARLQVFATIAGGNSFFKGVTLFWQVVTVSCSGGNKQVLLIAVKNRSPAAILRYSAQFFHLNETE